MEMKLKKIIIRLLIITIIVSQFSLIANSQEAFDSKGKDFWLTYIPNYHNNLTSEIPYLKYGDSLYIFITTENPTRGLIEYFDRFGNFYEHNFTISNPKDIYTFKLSYYDYELWGYNSSGTFTDRNQSEIVSKMSFHIESEDEITVYAHSQAVTTSDAFLVLPTDVLGRNYYVMSFPSDGYYLNSNQVSGSSTPSQFAIVATEDNTTITIIPTAPTKYNGTKIQNIVLDKGNTYLVQADIKPTLLNTDLTGTEIISDKPIAIFSGHQRTRLPINPELYSRDILIEQLPPIDVWGKNAFVVPFYQVPDASLIGSDVFRVLAANDNTEVLINDSLICKLNKGEFFESEIHKPLIITSSAPVLVAQFKKTSQDQNNSRTISDPFMMLIPPKEQFLKSYKVINTQAMQYDDILNKFNKVYDEQYITIVLPKANISSLRIDNSAVDPSIFSDISNSGYSYANIRVADGVHLVEADVGFGIYVYGYGIANSYGYIGGMGFKSLDIKPPEINCEKFCFKVKGMITDTGKTDSGIKLVNTDPDSNDNVNVIVQPYRMYDKIVYFDAELIDRKKDGKFIIKAVDSIGYFSNISMNIAGSTISYEGILTDTLPIKHIQSSVGTDTCINIVIKNYGKFPQKINNIFIDNNDFSIKYTLPKIILPNESDTIELCISIRKDMMYFCTILIQDDCLKKEIAKVMVSPNICDITSFDYTNFNDFDYKNLNLVQKARRVNDFVRLSRTEYNSVGALWYKNPIPIAKGFTCKFKFRISQGSNNETNESSLPGADGIAFVIQNASTEVFGSSGGGIGYNGIPNSLAIEYDVFNNDSSQMINLNDPNGNHIAIMCNGNNANSANHSEPSCLGTNPNIITIRSDSTIYYSKIEYNIEPNTLKIYLDTTDNYTKPVLSINNIDISKLLELIDGKKAYLGFTSATGNAWQNHDILSWYLCPIPQLPNDVKEIKDFDVNDFEFLVFPNPVDNNFEIKFNNPKTSKIKFSIIDVLGREVNNLYDAYLPAGINRLHFDINDLSFGLYYIKCESDKFSKIKKLIIGK